MKSLLLLMFRILFPRVIKRPGANEVIFKAYNASMKTYEFGPLPAGRKPEL